MKKLSGVPGVVDVDTSLVIGKPELGRDVDRSKAADLGVNVADVAETPARPRRRREGLALRRRGEQYDVISARGRSTAPTKRASADSPCPRTASAPSRSTT